MSSAFWMPVLALAIGYLLGSILSAIWICKLFHIDITRTGSGNPGMTNVWRTLGWQAALPVALLDALKGFVAAWIGFVLTHSIIWSLLAGVAAVVGHSFSIFAKFKGGKGVLTGFAVILFLSPIASLSSLTLWFVVLLLTRFVSLASLAAAVTLPVFVILESRRHHEDALGPVFWVTLIICAFVIFRHRANVSRLIKGTEPRFKGKAA